MEVFYINQIQWKIYYVSPRSHYLLDRTGEVKLATTDIKRKIIFVNCTLKGDILYKVLLHEICHAAIESYGLMEDIRIVVIPEYWFISEEWLCNFISDYALTVISLANSVIRSNSNYSS